MRLQIAPVYLIPLSCAGTGHESLKHTFCLYIHKTQFSWIWVPFWLHFSTTFQILYSPTRSNKSYSHSECLCGSMENGFVQPVVDLNNQSLLIFKPLLLLDSWWTLRFIHADDNLILFLENIVPTGIVMQFKNWCVLHVCPMVCDVCAAVRFPIASIVNECLWVSLAQCCLSNSTTALSDTYCTVAFMKLSSSWIDYPNLHVTLHCYGGCLVSWE